MSHGVEGGVHSHLGLRRFAAQLKAVSNPARLRLLHLLRRGERCVCHLMAPFRLERLSISEHLAVVHRAGLVEERKCAGYAYYRLSAQDGESLLSCLCAAMGDDPQLTRDVARLLESKASSKDRC